MNWPWLGLGILTIVLIVVTLQPVISFDDSGCCSICESYWAYDALEDEKDNVIDDCGGVLIALRELWDDYNNGKGGSRSHSHLDYLEEVRIANDASGRSFNLINLSNPCPISPNLKYIGTGLVYDFIPWSYDGPAYSIIKVCINGTNWKLNNCGADINSTVHVFKQKHSAWHNIFKDTKLYDASKYPLKPDQINQKWDQWYIDYQNYLDNGGVDVGDQFWM